MDYDAPRIEERAAVSVPLNLLQHTSNPTPDLPASPRWRTTDAEEV